MWKRLAATATLVISFVTLTYVAAEAVAVVEIEILLPASSSSDLNGSSRREGVTRRTLHVWINNPSFLKWHARPDQIPNCQRASYKDGDQESKDVPPGGSAYYDDSGTLIFKLLQLKPGVGRDPIRPNQFSEREGLWVKMPPGVTSRDFTYVITAVDGKGQDDQ